MIQTAILFISLAGVCYTVAVWGERLFIKKINLLVTITFGVGLLFDLTATSIMSILAVKKFSIISHATCGYLALIIMLLHLILAILAIKKIGKCEKYFKKFLIVAWII